MQHWGSYKVIEVVQLALADRSRPKYLHSMETCLFIGLSSSRQPQGMKFRYLMMMWAAADAFYTMVKKNQIAETTKVQMVIFHPETGRVHDASRAYLKTRRE